MNDTLDHFFKTWRRTGRTTNMLNDAVFQAMNDTSKAAVVISASATHSIYLTHALQEVVVRAVGEQGKPTVSDQKPKLRVYSPFAGWTSPVTPDSHVIVPPADAANAAHLHIYVVPMERLLFDSHSALGLFSPKAKARLEIPEGSQRITGFDMPLLFDHYALESNVLFNELLQEYTKYSSAKGAMR